MSNKPKYFEQDLPIPDLPEATTPVNIRDDGLFKLKKVPDWIRRPLIDGWYLFRFDHDSPDEVIRIVKCRMLGDENSYFDLGFSIEHESMGCIHRNRAQKEFWFALIDLDKALVDPESAF
jgi:hypothetical protein